MSTITKEQAKDLRNAFECWQQDYDPVEDKEQYDMFGLGMVAMDALLASLEAEAVAEVCEGFTLRYIGCGPAPKSGVRIGDRLYTAPPAPVSVPDAYTRDERGRMMLNGKPEPRIGYGGGWNACRAAMLQGAENAGSPTTMKSAPTLDSSPKIAESPSGNSPVIADDCGTAEVKT